MPPIKKIMLQSRLQRRLRELNIPSFKEYVDFVFSEAGMENEVIHMIDVVSTNKTDFFREPHHFDFLTGSILPQFVQENPQGSVLKVWSAGCSSGEEPYTIAMVISDFKEKNPMIEFKIFASDISTKILKEAIEGIYRETTVENLPLEIKRKYLLKSKDRTAQKIRVIPELRKKVSFSRINFMDNDYHSPDDFHVIFCRNVLIYFERETQEKVIQKLCSKLRTGGYFFLGPKDKSKSTKSPSRP